MKYPMYLAVFVLFCLAGLAAYVRLAPDDVARWHQPINATSSKDFPSGAIRVFESEPSALMRVDAAARTLPRTSVLAGSVEDGRITYITRTKWAGFPDYTTIEYRDGQLRMHARLRYGLSDLGVNGKRLQGLRAAAEGG